MIAVVAGAVRGRIERGDEAEGLATGHPLVELGFLGEVADFAAIAGAGDDGDPCDRCAAAGRSGEPCQDLDGGRLAGAVGAEEAVDGSGRDLEAEVGEGLDAGIVLGQSGHRDGRVDGHRWCSCVRRNLGVRGDIRFVRKRVRVVGPRSRTGRARWSRSRLRRLIPWDGRPAHPGEAGVSPRSNPGGPVRPRRRARPPAPGRAARACRTDARCGSSRSVRRGPGGRRSRGSTARGRPA